VGSALASEVAVFGMENVDLKTLTGDDQSFRLYAVMGLSALSERVTNLGELVKAALKEVADNKERLIQIDLKGTHGLAERVAAHEKWMDDIRKQFSDHILHCPVVDRMTIVENALRDLAEESGARAEALKGLPELQKQVQALTVAIAENTGAKGQKESDWRTTLIMIGMAVSTLLSLIGLFRKG